MIKQFSTLIVMLTLLSICPTANATVAVFSPVAETEITDAPQLSAENVMNMDRKQLEAVAGRKLKMKERLGLWLLKKKLKKAKKKGATAAQLDAIMAAPGSGNIDILWLLLGVLLGLIGVLLAYIFKGKGVESKSAWIGLGIIVAIVIIINIL